MIALDDDHAILDRATRTAPVFQLGCDFLHSRVILRKTGSRRNGLPLAAFRLSFDTNNAVARTVSFGFRFSLPADALGLWPAALWAHASRFCGIDQG